MEKIDNFPRNFMPSLFLIIKLDYNCKLSLSQVKQMQVEQYTGTKSSCPMINVKACRCIFF